MAEDFSVSSAPLHLVLVKSGLRLLHCVRSGACMPADLSNSAVPRFMPHSKWGQLALHVIALF